LHRLYLLILSIKAADYGNADSDNDWRYSQDESDSDSHSLNAEPEPKKIKRNYVKKPSDKGTNYL